MLKDVTTEKTYETKREKAERTNPPESEYEKECRELFEKHKITPATDGLLDSLEEFCARNGDMSRDEINQSLVRHTAKRMGGPKAVSKARLR